MFKVVNLSLKEANEFIAKNHRHHQPVYRDKYQMGVEVDGVLCGVAQVGRPVSRHLDDGKTLEVVRLCVLDGVKNACSFLYSRCSRVAAELGYSKIITYILDEESGNSLVASEWKLETSSCGGGNWSRKSRPRNTSAPTCKKQRWARVLCEVEE